MNFAVNTLHDIQRQLGGLMVYLECEEKEPLLKFYQEQNGFRHFGERLTEYSAETERRLAAPLFTTELLVLPERPVRQTIFVPSPG